MMSQQKIISYEQPSITRLEQILQAECLTKYTVQALKSYKQKLDMSTGLVKVEYTVDGFGRFKQSAVTKGAKTYYTGTQMEKTIRGLLFEEAYDDLDIVNASGNIMYQLFEKNKLESPYLKKYVTDRETCLQKVMNELKCERITAKGIFIEIFFGGTGKVSAMWELDPSEKVKLPKICKKLSEEYKTNVEALLELPEFAKIRTFVYDKVMKEEKTEAHFGKYAAYIYQDEERKVLECIVEYVKRKGKKIDNVVGALIFDGLHVRKEFEVKKVLGKIEEYILSQTGYSLKLEVKDFGITIEDREKYLSCSAENLTYEAKKALFEKTRFKIRSSSKQFVCYDESLSGETEENLVMYDKNNFTTAFEDWVEEGKQFLTEWYQDTKKRCYDRIEFACVKPENQLKNVFYAFPKFVYTKYEPSVSSSQRKENIAFFVDYINCLAEDNSEYGEWILDWLADLFQNPDTKGATPISVVLYGKQGSGKSWLTDVVASILGLKFVHRTSNPTRNGDVLHDFNKALRHKLLIEFAEINMKIHAPLSDRIKDLITADYHEIVFKNKDSALTKATERCLFTTNHSNSIVIEKGDRRYCAFNVSERLVGKSEYWNSFADKLQNQEFIADIADFLLHRDISKVCLRDTRPLTSYYKMLQVNSLPVELDFIKDIVLYSIPVSLDGYEENGQIRISSTELFSSYSTWRDSQKLDRNVTNKSFTMKIQTMGDYGISLHRTSACMEYRIDTDALKNKLFQEYGIETELVVSLSKPEPKVEPKIEPKVEPIQEQIPQSLLDSLNKRMAALIAAEREYDEYM